MALLQLVHPSSACVALTACVTAPAWPSDLLARRYHAVTAVLTLAHTLTARHPFNSPLCSHDILMRSRCPSLLVSCSRSSKPVTSRRPSGRHRRHGPLRHPCGVSLPLQVAIDLPTNQHRTTSFPETSFELPEGLPPLSSARIVTIPGLATMSQSTSDWLLSRNPAAEKVLSPSPAQNMPPSWRCQANSAPTSPSLSEL